MFKYISSFAIEQFSAAKTYEKYSVVRNSSGYFFVSIRDGNTENANSISGASNGVNWMNFESHWDIFSVWKPSIGAQIKIETPATQALFKGSSQYEVIDKNMSASTSVSWDSMTYSEYKSLLCFLEYKSQVGFYVSNSFGKIYKIGVTAITKSFNSYNNYSLACSLYKTRFYDTGAPIK